MTRRRAPGFVARAGAAAAVAAAAALLLAPACRAPEAPRAPAALRPPAPEGALIELAGAVHVHGEHSHDSQGTLGEVLAAAIDERLDFVVVTDHGSRAWLAAQGVHGPVTLLVGEEASVPWGHLIVIGGDPAARPWPRDVPAAELVRRVRAAGGFPVIAHPTTQKRWQGWDVEPPIGIEVANFASEVRAHAGAALPALAHEAAGDSRSAARLLWERPAEPLERADALARTGRVAFVGGADAHGTLRLGAAEVGSYRSSFAFARTHVLARSRQPRAIEEAIAAGRTHVGLDALAASDGFRFEARASDGGRTDAGGEIALGRVDEIDVTMPRGDATVVLLRDGVTVAERRGRTIRFRPSGAGSYRVEATLPGDEAPWILSSPIRVLP